MGERPHKKLEAWRKGIELSVRLYRVTAGFPTEERFGLTAQIRRAAVSVPANIAEGAARGSKKYFINAIQVARGSLSELDTHLEISGQLGYLDQTTLRKLLEAVDEVERILNGLARSLRGRSRADS